MVKINGMDQKVAKNGTKLDSADFQKFLDNDSYCLIF